MKSIPWWFVGGAVVTVVTGVVLYVAYDAVGSFIVGWAPWGALIGMEIQRRRLAAKTQEVEPSAQPRGLTHGERVAAGIFTLALLGLSLAFTAFPRPTGASNPASPILAIMGAVFFAIAVVLLLVARRRVSSNRKKTNSESARNSS